MLPVAWSVPAAGALLAQVVPQYAIDSPCSCVFWRAGASAIYRVEAASGTAAARQVWFMGQVLGLRAD